MLHHAQLGFNQVHHAMLLNIHVPGNRPITVSIFAGPACRYLMYRSILFWGNKFRKFRNSIRLRGSIISTRNKVFPLSCQIVINPVFNCIIKIEIF